MNNVHFEQIMEPKTTYIVYDYLSDDENLEDENAHDGDYHKLISNNKFYFLAENKSEVSDQ